MELRYLAPELLEPDPDGIRADTGDVAGLAATMRDRGVLQPLGVVEQGDGRYRIVYGGRRHAAALQLGLSELPCLVLKADEPDLLMRQVIENLQRQDLNDIDQARAFARLRAQVAAGMSGSDAERDEAVGRVLGIGGRTVRRYIGLLDLADDVQQLIRQGELNVTQAQHLKRVTNQQTQRDLARFAVAEGMSAAEISRLVAYFAANPNLSLEGALAALEHGAELRTRPTAEPINDGPLPRMAATTVDAAEDVHWDDQDAGDDDEGVEIDGFAINGETLENQPRNKARVFRIRTLDQMVDESDRLTRALHEGDLVKWVAEDDGAAYKVKLLLRQLETLTRALRDIARSHRLPIEDEG
jgi:ParB family chromosome partitioning protein